MVPKLNTTNRASQGLFGGHGALKRKNNNSSNFRQLLERLFESITQKKIEVGETKEDDMETGKDTRPDWTSIGFQVIFLGNFFLH